ncbi:uncharacterized protein PGTG_01647 [Puccinia graminis f. sp. tritici CRL 75-36-700-3]|uniref:ATP-dependent DNA helicase sgs1 n=1 Tax=Puccinia graminis f. sp. tritici (strain CRL 75-36-700-3 / race SCCL) TaxID=418459 RepID=E3JSM9_PUCGT|nr:uncharacterized protein PGTG_01647 [Puccinia graminis f. sp. tritici CRL 75-36-700-3]EFP75054.1 hypothetical protein PGTG_01647 [Puccinia graminis f. sp. tritici CRL 75-36-700-3]
MDGSSLAISVENLSEAHVKSTSLTAIKEKGNKAPLRLNQEITSLDNKKLIDYVTTKYKEKYEDNAKKLQVDTVCNLARGYHSFVLPGTRYGKSRIAELYFHMYAPQRRPVVLVLNPLDSLGEDQRCILAVNFKVDLSWLFWTRRTWFTCGGWSNWGKKGFCRYGIDSKTMEFFGRLMESWEID